MDLEDNDAGNRKKRRISSGGTVEAESSSTEKDKEINKARGPIGMRRAFDQNKESAFRNTKSNDGCNKQREAKRIPDGVSQQAGSHEGNLRSTYQHLDSIGPPQAHEDQYRFTYSHPLEPQARHEESFSDVWDSPSYGPPQLDPIVRRQVHDGTANQGRLSAVEYQHPTADAFPGSYKESPELFWSEEGLQNSLSAQALNDCPIDWSPNSLELHHTFPEGRELSLASTNRHADAALPMDVTPHVLATPRRTRADALVNSRLIGKEETYGHAIGNHGRRLPQLGPSTRY